MQLNRELIAVKQNHRTRMSVRLAVLFLLSLSVFLRIAFLAPSQPNDSFVFSEAAFSSWIQEDGRIPNDSYSSDALVSRSIQEANSLRPGATLLIYFGSVVSGIDESDLIFLPFGSIIMVLALLVLVRSLTGSILLASGVSVFLSLEPVNLQLTYGFFAVGIGMFLYTLFLYVLISSYGKGRRPAKFALLPVFFFAAFLYYQSAEIYMIASAFIFTILLSDIVNRRTKAEKMAYRINTRLPFFVLAFIVFLMVLDPLFTRTLVSFSSSFEAENSLAEFGKWVASGFSSPRSSSPIVYSYSNFTILYASLVLYIALILTVVVSMVSLRFARVRPWLLFASGSSSLSSTQLARWYCYVAVTVATVVVTFIAYAQYGFVNFGYVLFAFPILLAFLIALAAKPAHLRKNIRFVLVLLSALLVVSMASRFMAYDVDMHKSGSQKRSFERASESYRWIDERISSGRMLMSLETGFQLLIFSSPPGFGGADPEAFNYDNTKPFYYSNVSISDWIGTYSFRYLYFSSQYEDSPIASPNWITLSPMTEANDAILSSQECSKTYTDGWSDIYFLSGNNG